MQGEYWSDVDVDLVRRRTAEGWSATAIAMELNNGKTRNAVIGIRLRRAMYVPTITKIVGSRGRPPSGSPMYRTERLRKKKQAKAEYVAPSPPPDEPESHQLLLTALTKHTCRYPHGDGPYTFCGHKVVNGSAYCPYHRALTHTKASQRDIDRQATKIMGKIGAGGRMLSPGVW